MGKPCGVSGEGREASGLHPTLKHANRVQQANTRGPRPTKILLRMLFHHDCDQRTAAVDLHQQHLLIIPATPARLPQHFHIATKPHKLHSKTHKPF